MNKTQCLVYNRVSDIFDKYIIDNEYLVPYLGDDSLVNELENFLGEMKREEIIYDFSVGNTIAFDSPGVTVGVISVCWYDNDRLQHLMCDWEIR